MTSEERIHDIAGRIPIVVGASADVTLYVEDAAALRDVLARLEAAEADTRRLDWAGEVPCAVYRDTYEGVLYYTIRVPHGLTHGDTLREAIDMATGETPDKTA